MNLLLFCLVHHNLLISADLTWDFLTTEYNRPSHSLAFREASAWLLIHSTGRECVMDVCAMSFIMTQTHKGALQIMGPIYGWPLAFGEDLVWPPELCLCLSKEQQESTWTAKLKMPYNYSSNFRHTSTKNMVLRCFAGWITLNTCGAAG